MSFDTDMALSGNDKEQSTKRISSFDLIVKDLSINKLFPVLILNSDGEVAFDRFNGFYYT